MESKIVIGTWPLSGDYGPIEFKKVQEILEYCYEKGFREFDTSPSYGNGFMEFCLGKVFYDKDVLINTKIGNIPFKGKSFRIADIKESFKQSLKRLHRDSINILFLHNPRDEHFPSLLEFLNRLKDEGKIKYTGISIAPGFDYNRKVDLNEFDVVQDDANLLKMNFLDYNLPSIFMARTPLASGLLTGTITSNTIFSEEDQRSGWLKGERLKFLLERVEAIKKVSNIKLISLAKRFLLNSKKINKVIFGVQEKWHIDELIEDINSPPLSREIEEKLIHLWRNDFGLVNKRHLGY